MHYYPEATLGNGESTNLQEACVVVSNKGPILYFMNHVSHEMIQNWPGSWKGAVFCINLVKKDVRLSLNSVDIAQNVFSLWQEIIIDISTYYNIEVILQERVKDDMKDWHLTMVIDGYSQDQAFVT